MAEERPYDPAAGQPDGQPAAPPAAPPATVATPAPEQEPETAPQPEPAVRSAPGWYHDPGGLAGAHRWWDGRAWTDWLGNSADLDPPAETGHSVRPDPLIGRRTRLALLIGLVVLLVLALLTAVLTWWGIRAVLAIPPAATAPAEPGEPQILAPEITADYSRVSVRGLWGAELPSYPFVPGNRDDPSPVPYEGVFSSAANGYVTAEDAPDWSALYHIGLVDPEVPGTTSEELALGLGDALVEKLGSVASGTPTVSEPTLRPGIRSGSVLAEFTAETTVDRVEGESGDYVFSYQVQAEVWPDGTRTAWVSTIGLPADAPEPALLPEVRTLLADSLATTV